jgi:hypothetical protein
MRRLSTSKQERAMATRKSPSKTTTRARRLVRDLSKAGRTALDRAKPQLRKAYGRAKVAARTATAQAGELIRAEIHHLSAPKPGARSSKPKRAANQRRSVKRRSTAAKAAAKRAVRTVRKTARKGARRANLL